VSQIRGTKPKGLFSLHGVVCLFLAFMVLAWGTNYKLSLYKAGCESSPAKVCTRGSDAAKSALAHAANGRALAQASVSMAVRFSLLQGVRDCPIDLLLDKALGDLSPLSRAPMLHLRPPPDERRLLA
jgi:hypothetical protein